MKLNQILAIAVAGVLWSAAQPAGAAVFNGAFAPADWQPDPSSVGGYSYAFSSDLSTLHLSTAASGYTDLILKCGVSQSFSLNISVTLTQNGNDGSPLGFYIVDGTSSPISMGTTSIQDIPVSSSIAFELSGTTVGGKNPATLDISFTDFTPVPEPGTWSLAGGILLGGIYLVFAVIKQVRLRRAA